MESPPYPVHFEEAAMIRKNEADPPPHEKYARKDVFRTGPDEDSAVLLEVKYRFRVFSATFMGHCHNTQQEDHGMLMCSGA
jgi:FtsP/CotA-like multicopper oxidase with cupredoxin domain